MRKNILSNFLSVLILAFGFFHVPEVAAHGDEPRIEIGAEQLNPGAPLDLRGVDFEPEEQINLALVGAGIEISLGSLICDQEGVFLVTIALPEDLAEGQYTIRVNTDDHELNSPPFTVWGAGVGEENEGQRSEEDVLLAPMPTNPARTSPTFPAAATPVAPDLETSIDRPFDFGVVAILFSLVLVVGLGGFLLRRR